MLSNGQQSSGGRAQRGPRRATRTRARARRSRRSRRERGTGGVCGAGAGAGGAGAGELSARTRPLRHAIRTRRTRAQRTLTQRDVETRDERDLRVGARKIVHRDSARVAHTRDAGRDLRRKNKMILWGRNGRDGLGTGERQERRAVIGERIRQTRSPLPLPVPVVAHRPALTVESRRRIRRLCAVCGACAVPQIHSAIRLQTGRQRWTTMLLTVGRASGMRLMNQYSAGRRRCTTVPRPRRRTTLRQYAEHLRYEVYIHRATTTRDTSSPSRTSLSHTCTRSPSNSGKATCLLRQRTPQGRAFRTSITHPRIRRTATPMSRSNRRICHLG